MYVSEQNIKTIITKLFHYTIYTRITITIHRFEKLSLFPHFVFSAKCNQIRGL